jgi:hypothetical protein
MRSCLFRSLIAAALLVPYAVSVAQVMTIVDVLKGERFRLEYMPAELPDDYLPVRLRVQGETSPLDMLMNPMMLMMGMMRSLGGEEGQEEAGPPAIVGLLDVSWTRGDVVRVHNGDYLVTYKPDLDMGQMMAEKAPEMSELTLKLKLVKLDSINTITAAPGVTRASLLQGAPSTPRQASPTAEAENRAKLLGIAMIMYATDFDDVMPYAQQTKSALGVIYPYVKSVDIFRSMNPRGAEWRFNMGVSGAFLSSVMEPASTPMFFESEAWPDGRRLVIFMDGAVRWTDEAAWEALQPRMRPQVTRVRQPLPPDYMVADFDRLIGGA